MILADYSEKKDEEQYTLHTFLTIKVDSETINFERTMTGGRINYN